MDLLKLIALDADDLAVVSAHVQDAVTKIGDLSYSPAEKRFVLPLHRFVWEIEAGRFRRPHNERRNSALHFERVLAVQTAGIDQSNKNDVLSLLAVRFEPGELPTGTVELVFSGNAAIRLDVEVVEARLADLGGAWEASSRPSHKV
jgi:urease beta subunit